MKKHWFDFVSKLNCSFAIIYGYYEESFFFLFGSFSLDSNSDLFLHHFHAQSNKQFISAAATVQNCIHTRQSGRKKRCLPQIGSLEFDTEIVSVNCKRSLFPFYFIFSVDYWFFLQFLTIVKWMSTIDKNDSRGFGLFAICYQCNWNVYQMSGIAVWCV